MIYSVNFSCSLCNLVHVLMTSLPGSLGWPVTGDKTLEFARNPAEFIQRNIKTCNSRVFQVRALNKPHVLVASNQGVKEILEGVANGFALQWNPANSDLVHW